MTSALVIALCVLALAAIVLLIERNRLQGRLRELQMHLEKVDAARREADKRLERFERARPAEIAAARQAAVEPLLVLDDHLQRARRAFQHIDDAALREGIEGVARDMERAWAQAGLERLAPAAGELFDPAVHEAIARQVGGQGEGPVVEHLEQAGFRADGLLLRPARVVVRVPEASPHEACAEPAEEEGSEGEQSPELQQETLSS